MEVLVFKTNIPDKEKINEVAPYLDSAKGVVRWNFDLEDIDNILRIEAAGISPRVIERTLSDAGYLCEELPD
ncbi:MAG TPA: hypothetical protein VGK25_09765 [Ignavibacteria bacterium]|jgi:hypothetical protein